MSKRLIVLVGCIGSGKTTAVQKLTDTCPYVDITRISQDEMGKKGHMKEFMVALENNKEIIFIDRMNFNKEQRARYIEPARERGYAISIHEFKVPKEICRDRVISRQNHPTVEADNIELANKIIDFYHNSYERVTPDEYDLYHCEKYNG